MKSKQYLILVVIILLGAILRFYNLNWDQSQHLHPDERFLTMVGTGIEWPKSISEYFSTSTSPLNPHNKNFSFYVYGTFPLFFTKLAADIFQLSTYNSFTLLGRSVSAAFDLLTIALIYLITIKFASKKTALIAAFLYSISVLPIQLSHFFTTDTFLNFFSLAVLYCLFRAIDKLSLNSFLMGGFIFGLALASKISAILLLPSLFLTVIFLLTQKNKKSFPLCATI